MTGLLDRPGDQAILFAFHGASLFPGMRSHNLGILRRISKTRPGIRHTWLILRFGIQGDHVSTNEKLLAASAVELRRRIGTKEISPVELLEACIARIERINPAVNAVTATCYDRAREEARTAEKAALRGEPLGLLHGLPTGIKDLDETGGLLTTYGSPLYRDFIPERDNAMVARVRAAGAIVVGKTNTPGIRRRRQHPQCRVGRHRQSLRSCAQRRGLVGRFGRGARVRHAARLHGVRYRRLPAHPCRQVWCRRFPPVSRAGARGAAQAGLDADLGRGPDGPHGCRCLPAPGGAGGAGRL